MTVEAQRSKNAVPDSRRRLRTSNSRARGRLSAPLREEPRFFAFP